MPRTSFNEVLANLAILTKSFIKMAPKAIAAGPVITLPMPLTNPFAKVLPSSSPPPSVFFMPSIPSFIDDKKKSISGAKPIVPSISASSWIDVVVCDAIADIVLFSISFFCAASPAAFPAISVAWA